MKSKKTLIEEYFKESDLMIDLNRLLKKFNISKNYLYLILRNLIKDNKIVKIKGRIRYYKKNE